MVSGHSFQQENSTSSEVKRFKIDATTDSVIQLGGSDINSDTNSLPPSSNSFSISGIVYIALIIGAILTVLIVSLENRKRVKFEKWNLEHREKMRGYKK
jgi:hypothetical protein